MSLALKKKNTLTDAEIVNDALDNIEGKTDSDGFVDDPFASMTDEEINTDIEIQAARVRRSEVVA